MEVWIESLQYVVDTMKVVLSVMLSAVAFRYSARWVSAAVADLQLCYERLKNQTYSEIERENDRLKNRIWELESLARDMAWELENQREEAEEAEEETNGDRTAA